MGRTRTPRSEYYNVRLDEVSLVDDGDNTGAHVVLWKRRPDGFEKLSFDDALRGQLADRIMSEVSRMLDAYHRAAHETANDPNANLAATLKENTAQLKAAIDAVLDKWIEGTTGEGETPPPANDGPPVVEAEKRRPMYFTKRSEVIGEATRRARVLMASDPDNYRTEAAARAHVWGTDDALVKAYYETPDDDAPGAPHVEPDIIAKTAEENSAFAEIQKEAERIVRESGYQVSESEARTRVANARPDLYERYRKEMRTR